VDDRQAVQRARELERAASAAQREGRFADAEASLRDAIAIWEQLFGPDDVDVLNDEMNIAVAWRRAGNAAGAAAALESVAERLSQCPHADAPSLLLTARNNLATAYRGLHRLDRARDLWLQCLAAHDANGATPNPERARVLDNVSVVLRDLADPVAAEAFARRGLAEWIALRGEHDLDTATAQAAVGAALLSQGRLDEAEPFLASALATTEAQGADLAVASTLTLVGAVAHRRGDRARAHASVSRALLLTRKHLPEEHPDVREIRASLDVLERG
jgi:tetratricopeptide (TPR) repeat protein